MAVYTKLEHQEVKQFLEQYNINNFKDLIMRKKSNAKGMFSSVFLFLFSVAIWASNDVPSDLDNTLDSTIEPPPPSASIDSFVVLSMVIFVLFAHVPSQAMLFAPTVITAFWPT